MNTETSLAVVPKAQEPLLAIIERAAKDPAIDVAKMEKLLELAERVHARQAEAEFDAAMNRAQAEMRPVATDSDNPQTRSRYASYGALDRAVRPIYSSHGFSLSFGTRSTVADRVTITCRVSHRAGHTERVEIDMPADGKGAKGGDVMTKTHATGSAVSYGMRYLLKMIFNLAIGEYDDDGNSAGRTAQKPSQNARKPQTPGTTSHPPAKDAPKGKPAATAAHFARMLELLKAGPGQENRKLVEEYFRKCDALLPEVETLDDLPMRYVPVNKEQMDDLIDAIRAFEGGEEAELAFTNQEPLAPKTPKEKPTKPVPEHGDAVDQSWYGVIVPVPHRGEKRDEYIKHPDTIGSLYEARHGTDDEAQAARQRLWGFVSHYEPKGWAKKDGTQMPPSESDLKFRESLDQFADWFEKTHPDEKL